MKNTILALLSSTSYKPSNLAKKLGISRQALHRHLRAMLAERLIEKHGAGPHVYYTVAIDASTSRVQLDYQFCVQQILPKYLKAYTVSVEQYLAPLSKQFTAQRVFNFEFLVDTAAVYSSNIEGNTLNINSFLNSRMAPLKHRIKESKEIEDLVKAYYYCTDHLLTQAHVLYAHSLLSQQFVTRSRQGTYRKEPVGVFSEVGLEYMAIEAHLVPLEMQKFFSIVEQLLSQKMQSAEVLFWASWIHLTIALIHPFSDGNGRIARLCEKWFLTQKIGKQLFALPSEQLYFAQRPSYYQSLKLGANYWEVDFKKSEGFFAHLPRNFKDNEH